MKTLLIAVASQGTYSAGMLIKYAVAGSLLLSGIFFLFCIWKDAKKEAAHARFVNDFKAYYSKSDMLVRFIDCAAIVKESHGKYVLVTINDQGEFQEEPYELTEEEDPEY